MSRSDGENAVGGLVSALAIVGMAVFGCQHRSDPTRPAPSPKKERVYLDGSACGFWSCERSWKQCVGPDLIVHLAGKNHSYNQRNRNSDECRPGGRS